MPAKRKGEVSQRKEAEWRKELKQDIALLKQARQSIKIKLDKGDSLRDQDLRFLEHYPDILRRLREKEVEVKEEVLPEGKLKEWVERCYKLQAIGELESVIEITGYYRCDECGELHVLDRKCMYLEFKELSKEYKEIKVDEEIK